jgi:hypothetical protein
MFDLLIIYWDGCKKIVSGVSEFGIISGHEMFYYTKNNRRSYITADTIRFIGNKEDYI